MSAAPQAEGAPQAPKKNLGKLMLPLFAALNLVVLGGGAFLTYKSTIAYTPPELTEAQAAVELKKEREIASAGPSVMYTMSPVGPSAAPSIGSKLYAPVTFPAASSVSRLIQFCA